MEIFVQKWYLGRPKEQFPLGMREMGFSEGRSHSANQLEQRLHLNPQRTMEFLGCCFMVILLEAGEPAFYLFIECGLPLGKSCDIISDRSLQLREMLREGPSWVINPPRSLGNECLVHEGRVWDYMCCTQSGLSVSFGEFDLLMFTYSESKMILAFSRRSRISYWINIILAIY